MATLPRKRRPVTAPRLWRAYQYAATRERPNPTGHWWNQIADTLWVRYHKMTEPEDVLEIAEEAYFDPAVEVDDWDS